MPSTPTIPPLIPGTAPRTMTLRSTPRAICASKRIAIDTPTSSSGTSVAMDINVNVGWKIPLGSDRMYIDPNIAIGNFFSTSSDDVANLGFYVAAGLSFGMVF